MRRLAIFLCAAIFAAPAAAHEVRVLDFDRLEARVKDMVAEMERLRNAVGGSDTQRRFEELSGEISRLTGEVEQLGFQIRSFQQDAKRQLEDLEYRVIELEGGDPTQLYENNTDDGLRQQNALSNEQQSSVGTLGTLTTGSTGAAAGPEQAAFDAAVAAVKGGRTAEAKNLLNGFLATYPNSPLAGDAYFWLGESFYADGDYRSAAGRFLDAATLYPSAGLAPESLLKLGVSLSLLGEIDVACSTFREIGQRYPSAADTLRKATAESQRAGCG